MKIALDLDGTIHSYVTPWVDEYTISDEPIDGALAWMCEALDDGHKIIIHTARFAPGVDTVKVRRAIQVWLYTWGMPSLYIKKLAFHDTVGKPHADVYLDDRGYRFNGKYPNLQNLDTRPWNKK